MIGREKPGVLAAGVLGSLLFLIGLLVVQSRWPALLEIPSAWMGIAVLPLLLALLTGGYIRTFRGFGIEVEAALETAVADDVTAQAASDYDPFSEATDLAGDVTDAEMVLSKASMGRLHSLEPRERAAYQRLSFRQGYRGYHPFAIEEHLQALPGVKWIEIDDPDGGFLGVIRREDLETGDLQEFVSALEAGSALDRFPGILASEALGQDTPLRQVALAFRSGSREALPVTRGRRLLGMIERTKVYERIGEAVARTLA